MKHEIRISVRKSDNMSDTQIKNIFETQLNYGWHVDAVRKVDENSFGIENGKIIEYDLFVFTVVSNSENIPKLPPVGSGNSN